jgi:hypothetical protein
MNTFLDLGGGKQEIFGGNNQRRLERRLKGFAHIADKHSGITFDA